MSPLRPRAGCQIEKSVNQRLPFARAMLYAGASLVLSANSIWGAGWTSLTSRGPFGSPPPVPAAVEPVVNLEVRGVIREADGFLVNVYDITAKRSWWMRTGESVESLVLKSYDVATEKAVLEMRGKTWAVALKASAGKSLEGLLAQSTERPGGTQTTAQRTQAIVSQSTAAGTSSPAAIANEIRARREKRLRQSG